MIVDIPRGREDVVVLPEVIGGLIPIGAVGHLVTLSDIVTIGVLSEIAVSIIGHIFIERVKLAQSYFVHVLVSFDSRIHAISTIHQAHVVVTCRHTIPGLTSLLEIANVLITDLEVILHPGKTSIIRTATSTGSMDEAIGIGLMVGSIEDKMLPQ